MLEKYIIRPEKLDKAIKTLVQDIEKGFKLQQLEIDEASSSQRIDYIDCLILKPEYQREYRSTVAEESSLIESLLIGIPIPPVFLCSTRIKGVQVLDVVDGQHRLYAFYRFINNMFALSKLALLPEYNDKYFKDLEIEDQERIVGKSNLLTYVFRDFPGKDFELEVFNRYNKGTKTLTTQEIRNAVYASPHNEYVAKFVKSLYEEKEEIILNRVYNVTKDRFLKKKVHEGIFSILYVLEYGINEKFKDSTSYADEYMKKKSELVDGKDDLYKTKEIFNQFNKWLVQCTKVTPYPLSRELYGISSKSYKFQTSMALIISALYRKIYLRQEVFFDDFDKMIEAIIDTLKNSFIENPNYSASSTNSKEIFKLVEKFPRI